MALRIATGLALVTALFVTACSDSSTEPTGPTPVLLSVSPATGTVGTEVRLEGSGFTSDASAVFFGNLPASGVELDGGSLFVHAPEGLVAGETYDVRVVNDGAQEDTLPAAFEAVPPRALRVNGATRPTGLKGMTVIVEGQAFGDLAAHGAVYFEGDDGTPVEGVVSDPDDDWADGFVVTTVPEQVGDTTAIWVETATGTSDPIEFVLIQTAGFSPSTINWTRTTDLPEGLRGLGAAFIPIENGDASEPWVYVVGGADGDGAPVDAVIRAAIGSDGSIGTWDEGLSGLPEARAHHALAAATPATAALDTLTTAAHLYALGGIDTEGEVVSTVYAAQVGADGQVNTWREETALPEPLHSSAAAIFRGYLYLAGGADGEHTASSAFYRAQVDEDGSLGSWETLDPLSEPRAYLALVSFGPYLYAVGGETGTATPTEGHTGGATSAVEMARIDLRTGDLRDTWAPAGDGANTPKARSKHSTIFAGGFLFTTSGLYSGLPGSSENEYAAVGEGGALGSWSGATGANTIKNALTYSLYDQAAISFVDAEGNGRVLVLGGGKVEHPGEVSEAVLFF